MKTVLKTALIVASLFAASAMAENPVVSVETSVGDFKLELYPEKAPKSVENFLKYVEDGSYVGTQFHRVIPGFVAQGGGFDAARMRRDGRPSERGRRDRADGRRTVWGRARRGDDARARRRGSGRKQAERVRVDRADARRAGRRVLRAGGGVAEARASHDPQ